MIIRSYVSIADLDDAFFLLFRLQFHVIFKKYEYRYMQKINNNRQLCTARLCIRRADNPLGNVTYGTRETTGKNASLVAE